MKEQGLLKVAEELILKCFEEKISFGNKSTKIGYFL